MKPRQPDSPATCPSCGAPRLEHAWDCAKCGAVFDAGASSAAPEQPPARAADTDPSTASAASRPRSSSARRGDPAPRRSLGGSTPPALTALRGWVDDNRAAAVVISFVIYVIAVWIFGALIIGGTDAPAPVKSAYRELTGRPVPKGFGPKFAAHFVSRRLIAFDRADRVYLVVYRDEDGTSDRELRRFAERVLETFEIPFQQERVRTAETRNGPIEVPVLRLWGDGGPHLYLIPTATTDGERALEAVLGEPKVVLEVVEDMVEYR